MLQETKIDRDLPTSRLGISSEAAIPALYRVTSTVQNMSSHEKEDKDRLVCGTTPSTNPSFIKTVRHSRNLVALVRNYGPLTCIVMHSIGHRFLTDLLIVCLLMNILVKT